MTPKKDTSELEKLKAENARLKDALKKPDPSAKFAREIAQLTRQSNMQTHSLPAKTVDDHKNVYLYHTNGVQIGKRVGDLHPNNAKSTMEQFLANGIILSLEKPSEEEIAEYKATDEYKKLKKIQDEEINRKKGTRGKNSIERLANMLGVQSKPEIKSGV